MNDRGERKGRQGSGNEGNLCGSAGQEMREGENNRSQEGVVVKRAREEWKGRNTFHNIFPL